MARISGASARGYVKSPQMLDHPDVAAAVVFLILTIGLDAMFGRSVAQPCAGKTTTILHIRILYARQLG